MALKKKMDVKISYRITNHFELSETEKVPSTITNSLTLENSYIQITNILGDKNELEITVSIFSDASKVALVDIEKYKFTPDVDSSSDNFIKQGYSYLKTLEKYSDAIDVLEDGQML